MACMVQGPDAAGAASNLQENTDAATINALTSISFEPLGVADMVGVGSRRFFL